MKKFLAIFLAAVMAAGMTGCGKNKNTNANMDDMSGTALEEAVATEAAKDAEQDTTEDKENAEDTSKQLEDAEDQPMKSEDKIGEFNIAIGDAKIIDSVDGKAVVIEFTFKNNTDHPQSYDGIFDETVMQGDSELRGATVIDKIEGYDPLSATTPVNHNETATAQKAYALNDETTDIVVTAYQHDQPDQGMVSKTFKLK